MKSFHSYTLTILDYAIHTDADVPLVAGREH
jgi:hypothetical protein